MAIHNVLTCKRSQVLKIVEMYFKQRGSSQLSCKPDIDSDEIDI